MMKILQIQYQFELQMESPAVSDSAISKLTSIPKTIKKSDVCGFLFDVISQYTWLKFSHFSRFPLKTMFPLFIQGKPGEPGKPGKDPRVSLCLTLQNLLIS